MKILNYCAVIIFAFSAVGCTDNQVKQDLNEKIKKIGVSEKISEALDNCDNGKERDAIRFLYAYMPIGDIADYPADLYVKGVRAAFSARKEMPWGKTVPDKIFRHFVLPLRVNNETLDSARIVFYNELKDRVKDLSMYDAVLEVNHWCHEKVIYTPSDARTSSPLATMRSAYGRCGEESVFAVTALRAVGIPARQVYTPRWAHTDDNHAWVEVWVDGKWYYIGACEPEAKLNVAWFSSTVLRSLLVHTKVFGKYSGDEDIIRGTDCFTEINVTSNYAPAERIEVTVRNMEGDIVEGSSVEFKIYNYAEFYPAIKTVSDKNGRASAIFGKGNLLVWASYGDKFGYVKASGGDTVTVFLNRNDGDVFEDEIDIVPPTEGKVVSEVSEREAEKNRIRLAFEDSLRGTYTATFYKPGDTYQAITPDFLKKYDKKQIDKYLVAARGNWREILDYLVWLSPEKSEVGIKILSLISEKDLRDTPCEVLKDHIEGYFDILKKGLPDKCAVPQDVLDKYLLNPRIANELIVKWRGTLKEAGSFIDPADIVYFVRQVSIFNEYNPLSLSITPSGVLSLMVSDETSRDIFFVAMCRCNGIPARFEEISGKLQYYFKGEWHNVVWKQNIDENHAEQGFLKMIYLDNKTIADPKLETHFTLAKMDNGNVNTLNFRTKEGIEGSMSYKSAFTSEVELDHGYYMLTSGTRMASGRVLSHISFFNIEKEKITSVNLIMPQDTTDLQVIGSMDAESRILLPEQFSGNSMQGNTSSHSNKFIEKSILECTGRGFFVIAFVKPDNEPSNHVLQDFLGYGLDIPVVILYGSKEDFAKFDSSLFPAVKDNIHIGIDSDFLLSAVCKNMDLHNIEMPLVLLADSFGRICYITQGYTINIASRFASLL